MFINIDTLNSIYSIITQIDSYQTNTGSPLMVDSCPSDDDSVQKILLSFSA